MQYDAVSNILPALRLEIADSEINIKAKDELRTQVMEIENQAKENQFRQQTSPEQIKKFDNNFRSIATSVDLSPQEQLTNLQITLADLLDASYDLSNEAIQSLQNLADRCQILRSEIIRDNY